MIHENRRKTRKEAKNSAPFRKIRKKMRTRKCPTDIQILIIPHIPHIPHYIKFIKIHIPPPIFLRIHRGENSCGNCGNCGISIFCITGIQIRVRKSMRKKQRNAEFLEPRDEKRRKTEKKREKERKIEKRGCNVQDFLLYFKYR